MSSSNPIRELLSALFKAGSETVLQEQEEPPVPSEMTYMGRPMPSWVDPNTFEHWDSPSRSD
jgi:hypothetical protein